MKITYLSLALSTISITALWAEPSAQIPGHEWPVHSMERQKPEKAAGGVCLTTAPPADAIILFDGKDLSKWGGKGSGETAHWKVENGVLTVQPKGNIWTKESFQDVQLHIEFRIPKELKPNSQSGSNSGIFFMDKYEIQILESHANVTYADGQAAAMYGQFPPLKNASLPQGEWQSYDISFTAPRYDENGMKSPARVTVIHNGIVVQNNQAYLGVTAHYKVPEYPKAHPVAAPISLQDHNDPVEYRNIWARRLSEGK